jgi:hypothetical protein
VSAKPPDVRVNQAVMLLVGALFLVVVAPEPTRFYWTPLTLGLAYLSAAIVGGRDGGHWATACALTGWGAAVAFGRRDEPGPRHLGPLPGWRRGRSDWSPPGS